MLDGRLFYNLKVLGKYEYLWLSTLECGIRNLLLPLLVLTLMVLKLSIGSVVILLIALNSVVTLFLALSSSNACYAFKSSLEHP